MNPRRVLVTGASGAIGAVVVQGLRQAGHVVRGFDRAEPRWPGDHVMGTLDDPVAMQQACAGMEVLIHLAATPDQADFARDLVPNNIIGTDRILAAAVAAGVGRLIYASTCRVSQAPNAADGSVDPDAPVTPGDHYAVSKACGEILARHHGLGGIPVIIARIGWFVRNPDEAARMEGSGGSQRLYLSHHDAVRFFRAAVESQVPGIIVTYVTSRNHGRSPFAGANAARIGYDPLDSWPEGLDFPPGMTFASPYRHARRSAPTPPQT